MCIDYDEVEIAQWLLAQGVDFNSKAAIDADRFGGRTPLFSTGRGAAGEPIQLLIQRGEKLNRPSQRLCADEGQLGNNQSTLSSMVQKKFVFKLFFHGHKKQ